MSDSNFAQSTGDKCESAIGNLPEDGKRWLAEAASGDITAAHNLGVMYAAGHGVAVDYDRAKYWFEQAAEGGDEDAQWWLFLYLNEDSPQGPETLKWLREAARSGHAKAQSYLASSLLKHRFEPADPNEALRNLLSAAIQEEPSALENLRNLGKAKIIQPASVLRERAGEIELKRVCADDWLAPGNDTRLTELLEKVAAGEVKIYQGHVPIALIKPFDPGYSVVEHPFMPQLIDAFAERCLQGLFHHLFVYQNQDYFIMSDDYPAYYCYQLLEASHVPCIIIGEHSLAGVKNLRGPASTEAAREAIGLSA